MVEPRGVSGECKQVLIMPWLWEVTRGWHALCACAHPKTHTNTTHSHIHTHTHTHTLTHTHTQTHIHMHAHTQAHTRTHTHRHTHMNSAHTFACARTRTSHKTPRTHQTYKSSLPNPLTNLDRWHRRPHNCMQACKGRCKSYAARTK